MESKKISNRNGILPFLDSVALRLRRVTSGNNRYIAEIDGMRFIAIFSVLFYHVFKSVSSLPGVVYEASPFSILLSPFWYGNRGVQLFFIISGFILATPFASHYLCGGKKISIMRYYLRRITRLEPPYFVALIGFYIFAMILKTPDVSEPGFFSGLLLRLGYLHNIVRGVHAKLNGVTWTLEIEVQFYILAPLLARIFLFPNVIRRTLLLFVMCAVPFAAPFFPRSHVTVVGNIHYFLMGFLLADFHTTRVWEKLIPQFACDLLGFFAAIGMMFISSNARWFDALLPFLLALMFIAALRGRWFRKIMQQPVITVLGGACYSLYLLHYPVFSFVAQHLVHTGMTLPMAYVRVGLVGLPLALTGGLVFYVFLERPCMYQDWPQRLLISLFRRKPKATVLPADIPVGSTTM